MHICTGSCSGFFILLTCMKIQKSFNYNGLYFLSGAKWDKISCWEQKQKEGKLYLDIYDQVVLILTEMLKWATVLVQI